MTKMNNRTLSVALVLFLFLANGTSISYSRSTIPSSPVPITPIQHIVIIMQENHDFDNMFGVYPGLPSGFALDLSTCMPQGSGCVYPFKADSKQTAIQGQDICHSRTCAVNAYDGGNMDDFLRTAKSNTNPMAYYTGKTLPYYWDYASHFTLDYNFMSSALSFSLPNHLYAVAAQAGSTDTCTRLCKTQYNLTFAQIGQSLTNAGISWGYYQYNWNDKIDCPSNTYTPQFIKSNTHGGYDGFWSGLTDFVQVQHTPIECSSLLNYKDLQSAISSNTLPSVSWVEPAPSVSDHPGQSTWLAGQQYVASLVNLIEKSPEWSSTVIYLTWDDWGGYYDHVVPLQFDAAGEGFRVPLIAISPYSIPSGIVQAPSYNYGSDSRFQGVNQEDFSAFLSTIEYNWGLAPLTLRDTYEPNLFFMLNFHQQPLAPLILAQSGVTYPLSSCSPQSCSASTSSASSSILSSQHIVISPYVGNESQSQALNFSGDGDAGD